MTESRKAQSLPNEKQLVASARVGDKDAYRQLVEGYQDRLFGLVFYMVSQREQAEDLTQEIFVKAFFALKSFEGQSSFYTWIYRIASNHCLDFLRKHRPDMTSIDRPLTEDSGTTFENTLQAPESETPEASFKTPSEASLLLATLEPEQRLILTLRELENHSYEELADLLKCPINTVKSRLNRAREALKVAYEKKYAGNISDTNIVSESGEHHDPR